MTAPAGDPPPPPLIIVYVADSRDSAVLEPDSDPDSDRAGTLR